MVIVSNGDVIFGLRCPLAAQSILTWNSTTVRDTLKLSTECLCETLASFRLVASFPAKNALLGDDFGQQGTKNDKHLDFDATFPTNRKSGSSIYF